MCSHKLLHTWLHETYSCLVSFVRILLHVYFLQNHKADTSANAATTASSSSAAAAAQSLQQCPICTDDYPQHRMHTVSCGVADHCYCVNCLAKHCSTQLLDNGCVPRCPGQYKCKHELTRNDLCCIWEVRTNCTAYNTTK
jgi:hypothetical protein